MEEGKSLEWNKNEPTTQPEEGQLGKTSAVLKECRINGPNTNDRERCKGERQYGEDADRRSERRESHYRQGTRRNLDYGKPL